MGIGDLLRIIRGDDSLRVAAEKTKLSHTYIGLIEKGIDPRTKSPLRPSPETLKAYSSGYHFSYEELMKAAGYLSEDGQINDDRDAAERLIELLELELTNEEIIKRTNFMVDGISLSDDEADEFIAFVRAKRLMKKRQPASVSKSEEL